MASTDSAGVARPKIFIHTNNKQSIAAVVSAYSMKRNSPYADKFDVAIIQQEDYPFFARREGQSYLRRGETPRTWYQDDLQSFTLTRFMPPQLMGYQGRALVVDPDVFSVQDVWQLLNRDMHDNAIMCRSSKTSKGAFASSVMLLDCAKLRHWDVESGFNELFEGKRDYHSWISLFLEDHSTIGAFEDEWNDFDRLAPGTKMLHNAHRPTHPWKTGLPVDFTLTEKAPATGWVKAIRRKFFGEPAASGLYTKHPDRQQEDFFFGLLKEACEKGVITDAQISHAMQQDFIRHDAIEMMKNAPRLVPTNCAL